MPALRPRDTVRVEIIGSSGSNGVLDNFTSFEINTDITSPSEASFELGDDRTFNTIGNVFDPGTNYQVFINDRPRMRGRVEANDIPFDAGAGAVVRFTVRTKLADAQYASARQSTKVKNVTIKDFILDLYAPLGYTEADFIGLDPSTDPATARDLITGVSSINRGAPQNVNLEPLTEENARVRPPETIYGAADRHLRRHGLMHWDSPDGRIVISAPNDTQQPLYTFNMFRDDRSATNNVLSATRTQDFSGIPAVVGVFGRGGKRDFSKARIAALAEDADVVAAGFYRPLLIIAEGVKTQALAQRSANRELSSRSKQKDAFVIEVDGFSFWDGQSPIAYGPDTVAELKSDVAGGLVGAYYIHAVTLSLNAQDGPRTNLTMVRRGIWKL